MTGLFVSRPATVLRLAWATAVTLTVALSPGPAEGSLEYYDIETGKRTATFDPEGTDFGALRASIAGFRDQAPQILIASGSSFMFRDVETGEIDDFRVNFQLEGGDFDRRLLFTLDPSEIIGFRDSVESELALIGPSGIHVYNACRKFDGGPGLCDDDDSRGALAAVRNAQLSGGDFEGSTFSEIPAGAYVGYRDLGASQIAILGPSGINYYDIVTGNENGIFDPPLTGGGPFDGRRFSELAPQDFAGFRDAGGSQIALVPEIGPTAGSAAALATLALVARQGRRRPSPRPGRDHGPQLRGELRVRHAPFRSGLR